MKGIEIHCFFRMRLKILLTLMVGSFLYEEDTYDKESRIKISHEDGHCISDWTALRRWLHLPA